MRGDATNSGWALQAKNVARRRERNSASRLHAKLLLNVGRQVHLKGQVYLVDAFERLADRWQELELLIAGGQSTATADLEARRDASEIPERIHLLGVRDDVPDLLAAADIFVFPSLSEGLGGAVIEAMAMGLPIVCSDIAALRDVTDDGRSALLVPPRDPVALADAIARMIRTPQLATSLAEHGRQRFKERFTIDRCAPRMAALYRYVAAGGSAIDRG